MAYEASNRWHTPLRTPKVFEKSYIKHTLIDTKTARGIHIVRTDEWREGVQAKAYVCVQGEGGSKHLCKYANKILGDYSND